jgi:uncharacterized protein
VTTGAARCALVTGVSSGIGKELARLFAQDGIHLMLVGRGEGSLRSYAQELSSSYDVSVGYRDVDLADGRQVAKLCREIARGDIAVDYLVNNAGFGDYSDVVDANPDRLQQMIGVNVAALTALTRACAPTMQSGGRIMNIASIAGYLPGAGMAVYHATKAYVVSLSLALREELKPAGVHVTVLCPGPTKTQFVAAAHADSAAFFRRPLATAEDVAAYGYGAMMRGRAVAVPGLNNKLSVFGTRLLPQTLVARIVGKNLRLRV